MFTLRTSSFKKNANDYRASEMSEHLKVAFNGNPQYILYVCMYSFFYGTFMRMSMNNLDSVTNSTLHVGGSIPD